MPRTWIVVVTGLPDIGCEAAIAAGGGREFDVVEDAFIATLSSEAPSWIKQLRRFYLQFGKSASNGFGSLLIAQERLAFANTYCVDIVPKSF